MTHALLIAQRLQNQLAHPTTFRQPEIITKNGLFRPALLIDGQVKGRWPRSIKSSRVQRRVFPFSGLSPKERDSVQEAASRFAAFCRLEPALSYEF